MHDTAFQIGTLAMNIYADLSESSILEVGSRSINGSLRQNALPATKYTGIDVEAGEGVDVVVEFNKPLPFSNDSFDFVMASSVFEHDRFFWMTFLEMCRVANDGGYIYINAPSNGVVHRFPQDSWRFYPDSGKALAEWAVSQGHHITLVESFVADRQDDLWNDFVAVFRKGRISRSLPKVFVHEHVACSNVLTWKSGAIVNPSEMPEDLLLLRDAERRVGAAMEQVSTAEQALVEIRKERDSFAEEVAKLAAQVAEAGQLAEELRIRKSELTQRQEEIEQTRAELLQVRSEASSFRALYEREQARADASLADKQKISALYEIEKGRASDSIADNRKVSELYEREKVRASDALVENGRLLVSHADLEEKVGLIQQDLERTSARAEQSQARLESRFREIAKLAALLAESEGRERKACDEAAWLREAGSVLLNGGTSAKDRLRRLLPVALHEKRQRKLLKRKGIFDDQAYLQAHADVAADRADPLHHYIHHGIVESRRRG